jgi:membrane protein DedA with SNARE-associated domain
MGVQVYEILIFTVLCMTLECGAGILYGVGIGHDPLLVYPAAIIINFTSVFIAGFLIGRLLEWKKGLKNWLEKRLSRGQKLIDKYGWIGIIMGIFVLSPMQLAIIGRLVGMKPSKLYPALFVAIVIVATAFLGIALGIFKVLLS